MRTAANLKQLAALAEPNRRRVYDFLDRQARPVSRRELAVAVGLAENLLTFHLDKLAEAGVVRIVAARRRPGVRGRPARHYELADTEFAASVPPRRYDLVAEVLAETAREQVPDETFQASAERVALSYGLKLGRQVAAAAAPGIFTELLEGLGYAPRDDGATVVMENCPFDRLRKVNTPLVCGVNLALVQGYLSALHADEDCTARLEPDPARCCVVVSTRE